MTRVFLLLFFLNSFTCFSKDDSRCGWIDRVRKSNDIETQLQLIKEKYFKKSSLKCKVSLVYSNEIEKNSLEKLTSSWDIEARHLQSITYTENYLSEKSKIAQPAFVLHFNCSWLDQVRSTKDFKVQLDLIKKNYIFGNESICCVELSYTTNNPYQFPINLCSNFELELFESKQLDSIYFLDSKPVTGSKPPAKIVLAVNCDWIDQFTESNNIEEQLEILQANFGPCGLVIADGHPISSDTSTFPFVDMKLFINSIKKEEVNSINVVRGDTAKTLYGTAGSQGVIVLGFQNKKTKWEINSRVWEQLKKKSKH